MKIRYDILTGDILDYTNSDMFIIDGENVLELTDNSDFLENPRKYKINLSTLQLEKKFYLILSSDLNSAPADGTSQINVTIKKYTGSDVLDSSGSDIINIIIEGYAQTSQSQVTLINGEASFALVSTVKGKNKIICKSENNDVYYGKLELEFI
ncbi:MAG: hypothetical protein ACTSQY_10740 [Candidatus Odinarchaeia archaeon]